MFEIKINKPPLTKIAISDDLSELRVYINVKLIEARLSKEDQDTVGTILRIIKPTLSFVSGLFSTNIDEDGNFFILLSSLLSFERLTENMKMFAPKKEDIEILAFYKTCGLQHAIQSPLNTLYALNFIDDSQKEIIDRIVRDMLVIQGKLDESHKSVLDDVRDVLSAASNQLGTYPSESVIRTVLTLKRIQFFGGNFESVGAGLLFILLNEGAIDHFLKALDAESDGQSELRLALIAFQSAVARFAAKYADRIRAIIEKNLPHCDSGYLQLYSEYQSQYRGLRKYYNLDKLGCAAFFPIDIEERAAIKRKAQTGKVISDEEMAASAFGQGLRRGKIQ